MARVLIVDDDESIRRALGATLRADSYEVVEAEDAELAQQRLREAEFDVVVANIILPGLTGLELLSHIQSTAPHVQVVMLTGEPTAETAAESLRAGAADYLFKPISKAAILRSVANAVRVKTLEDTRRRLEAENRAQRENLERLVEERTAQLRASEQRFRRIFEEGPIGMVTVGADFHFVRANATFCKMLGYTEEELTTFTFANVTHPDHAAQDILSVRELIEGRSLRTGRRSAMCARTGRLSGAR
jgi:PAS domain S-box-containing protein